MESYGFCLNRYGKKEGASNQFPAGSVKSKNECLKKCKAKGESETIYGCEYTKKKNKDGSGNVKTCSYHTNKVYVGRDRWTTKAPICWIFGKENWTRYLEYCPIYVITKILLKKCKSSMFTSIKYFFFR